MKLYHVTVIVAVEAENEDDAYRVAEQEVGGCFETNVCAYEVDTIPSGDNS